MVNQTTKSIFSSANSLPPNFRRAKVASELAGRQYLRWDSPGVEGVPPGDAEQTNTQQRQQFDNHRQAHTGTLSQTQGIVKGTFKVSTNLPAHLRQGELFAKPAAYPAVCRYSTERGDSGLSSTVPAPRGFSMKIFNVKGDFFDIGQETPTQDIVFHSTPTTESSNASETRGMNVGDDMDAMNKEPKTRDDTEPQNAHSQIRSFHPASSRQYSQFTSRFGDYVIKYSLVPNTTTQENLEKYETNPEDYSSDNPHRLLQKFHQNHDAEYVFQVQLLENLEEQPVEYSGKIWDEERYPWQTVGTLKIPKQDSFDLERKMFWEDHIRIDPWHGLKAYLPLGGSNLLRRAVCPANSELRRKLDGTKEMTVKSIDEIPN